MASFYLTQLQHSPSYTAAVRMTRTWALAVLITHSERFAYGVYGVAPKGTRFLYLVVCCYNLPTSSLPSAVQKPTALHIVIRWRRLCPIMSGLCVRSVRWVSGVSEGCPECPVIAEPRSDSRTEYSDSDPTVRQVRHPTVRQDPTGSDRIRQRCGAVPCVSMSDDVRQAPTGPTGSPVRPPM